MSDLEKIYGYFPELDAVQRERLAALEERLACLGLALGEETFRPTEHGAEEAPAPQADAPRQ